MTARRSSPQDPSRTPVGLLRGSGAAVLALAVADLLRALLLVMFVIVAFVVLKRQGVGAAPLCAFLLLVFIRLVKLLVSVRFAFGACDSKPPLQTDELSVLRVALVTTLVPEKEPVALLRETLRAMRQVQYSGQLDCWVLDEGDSGDARAVCKSAGARHYSRKGVAWANMPWGKYRQFSKHGNLNAWLHEKGHVYDVVLAIDPDHVPRRDLCELMLPYFQESDVAFVVGPVVYGRSLGAVSQMANSQMSVFNLLVQRGGNATGCPMLVGSNCAIRVSALLQADGFQDSITEDMLTGLVMHSMTNPASGRRWRSVYISDLVTVGEAPENWAHLLNQQLRWARGGSRILFRQFHQYSRGMSWQTRLHYLFLLLYFPTIGLEWLLGSSLTAYAGFSGTIYGSLGQLLALEIVVAGLMLALWVRTAGRQTSTPLRFSPVPGLAMSSCCAATYARALLAEVVNAPTGRFAVTPKRGGQSISKVRALGDRILWASLGLPGLISVGGQASRIGSIVYLVICLTPVAASVNDESVLSLGKLRADGVFWHRPGGGVYAGIGKGKRRVLVRIHGRC